MSHEEPLESELERQSNLNLMRFYYEELLKVLNGQTNLLTSCQSDKLRSVGFLVYHNGLGGSYNLTPRFYQYFEIIRTERILQERSKVIKEKTRLGINELRIKRDSAKWASLETRPPIGE